jgi:integrase
MARLIYGSGLRLQGCHNLRIKDIDFKRNRLILIQGKGGKDRETPLPESIRNDLHHHLQWVWKIYLEDRKNDVPGVYLPYALQRKYPNAGRDWNWQWVFPSQTRRTTHFAFLVSVKKFDHRLKVSSSHLHLSPVSILLHLAPVFIRISSPF